jgi:hypothetical protein
MTGTAWMVLRRYCRSPVVWTLAFLALALPTLAQVKEPEGASAEELQKATQNPVASLISVPLQNNSNFNIPPNDRIQNVFNIQPVIPVNVGTDWNLIIRWIAPIIWQPVPTGAPDTGFFGFGDMQPTFFLSPKKGKLIWGVGPAFVIPSATNQRFLGQGKFSLGPSVVALVQPGHWTVGGLVNNVWSVAGPSERADVNQMLLQYFINYNLKKGWFITISPIITADWKATGDNRWVVPFGGGVGRIMKLGHQPVNISAQFYGNVVHPPSGSPWSMRLQLAFLFPKAPKKK